MALFGLIAKSEKAQHALAAHPLRLLPRSFPGNSREWWVEPNGIIAMLGAAVQLRSDGRVLALSVDGDSTGCVSHAGLVGRMPTQGVDAIITEYSSFAFAFWDGTRQTLYLGRDHFGQRQAFFRESPDALLFSSELEPLLLDPSWKPEMDLVASISYLLCGRPHIGATMARGIRSVPAAHYLLFNRQRGFGQTIRYWSPLCSDAPHTSRTMRQKVLRDVLRKAVRSRLSPSGNAILLSGGVDSSLLAFLASANSDTPISAFTIAFDNRYGEDDEYYAGHVAKAIEATHVVTRLHAGEAHQLLDRVLESPIPCSAWTAISHEKLLSEVAARDHPRLVSGMGADETFGGYDRFLDFYYRQRRYSRTWPGGKNADWFSALLNDCAHAQNDLFPGVSSFISSQDLRNYLRDPFRRLVPSGAGTAFYEECRALNASAQIFAMMVAHECQHRIPDLLMLNFEPIARAAGVSIGYPYLDPTLVRLSASLGPDDRYWYKNGSWWAKKMLRELAKGIVPDSIIMRRRSAYNVPFIHWLKDREFGPKVLDRLGASPLWKAGLFRPVVRNDLLREARAASKGVHIQNEFGERLWVIVSLAAWYDKYIENV